SEPGRLFTDVMNFLSSGELRWICPSWSYQTLTRISMRRVPSRPTFTAITRSFPPQASSASYSVRPPPRPRAAAATDAGDEPSDAAARLPAGAYAVRRSVRLVLGPRPPAKRAGRHPSAEPRG